MSILSVIAAAAALGLIPLLLDRYGTRIPPQLLARLDLVALVTSSTAMTAATALLAAPPLFRLLELESLARVCDRLLFHLGVALPPSVGWAGPLALLWITARVGGSARWSMHHESRLRAVASPGVMAPGVPYPVHYAALGRNTAFSLGGVRGVIVVSRELAEVLDEKELSVVLHHEAAHLRHGHGWMLRALGALDAAFGRLPGFRSSVRATRLAMERWADESALEASGCDRRVARRALLKATGVEPTTMPALSNIDSIVRRLRALSESQPSTTVWPGLAVAITLAAFGGLAVGGFYTWVSHGHAALALAGWCPV